jgi:hypothetical protein
MKTKQKLEKYELKLFPLKYDGKIYYEEDCDDVFICFYHCRESLNDECGVYMAEGIWVYPDGSMDEW